MGNTAASLRVTDTVLAVFVGSAPQPQPQPQPQAPPGAAGGALIYAVTPDGVTVFDSLSGKADPARAIRFQSRSLHAVVRDGRVLTADIDGCARIYELARPAAAPVVAQHPLGNRLQCVAALDADGLACGSQNGTVAVFAGANFATAVGVLHSPFKPQLPPRPRNLSLLAQSQASDDSSSAARSPDSQRRVRFEDESAADVERRRSLASVELDDGGADGAAGRRAGSGGPGSSASLPSLPPRLSVTCLCEDAARHQLVVGYSNGGVAVFSLSDFKPQNVRPSVHSGSVSALRHVTVTDVFLSAGTDGSVRVLSPHTLLELCAYQLQATSIDYSPRRDVVVLGTQNGQVIVLRCLPVAQRRLEAKLLKKEEVHNGSVTAVSYNPASDTVISGSLSGTLKVQANVSQVTLIPADIVPTPIVDVAGEERSLAHLGDAPRDAPQPLDIAVIRQQQERLALLRELINENLPNGRARSDQIAALANNSLELLGDQLRAYVSTFNQNMGEVRDWAATELDMERQLGDMKTRHARELAELQERQGREESELRRHIPALRRETAMAVARLEYAYQLKKLDAIGLISRSLELKLGEFFPRGTQLSVLDRTYQIGDPIGRGAPTAVYKAVEVRTGALVAVKVFPVGVQLASDLEHEVIVPCVDRVQLEANVFVMTPLMKETLYDFLERTPVAMDEAWVARFAFRILRGLAYLHARSIVHRDLRPTTVLLDGETRPFLTHFGVMRPLSGEEHAEMGQVFAAPEVLLQSVVPESDLWSLGIILLHCLVPAERRIPVFSGVSNAELLLDMLQMVGGRIPEDFEQLAAYCNINAAAREQLREVTVSWRHGEHACRLREYAPAISDEAFDLVCQCLLMNPNGRLRAAEALSHPFFARHLSNEELEVGGAERANYLPPHTPDSVMHPDAFANSDSGSDAGGEPPQTGAPTAATSLIVAASKRGSDDHDADDDDASAAVALPTSHHEAPLLDDIDDVIVHDSDTDGEGK